MLPLLPKHKISPGFRKLIAAFWLCSAFPTTPSSFLHVLLTRTSPANSALSHPEPSSTGRLQVKCRDKGTARCRHWDFSFSPRAVQDRGDQSWQDTLYHMAIWGPKLPASCFFPISWDSEMPRSVPLPSGDSEVTHTAPYSPVTRPVHVLAPPCQGTPKEGFWVRAM